jgi:hypothetical protein
VKRVRSELVRRSTLRAVSTSAASYIALPNSVASSAASPNPKAHHSPV